MKIHIHNIYITHKIVYKSAADSSSRSREITILKKVIQILTSNISEIYGPIILPSELDRELSKLTLQEILKRLIQLYSRNRWTYKTYFFYFSMFTFLLITKEPR